MPLAAPRDGIRAQPPVPHHLERLPLAAQLRSTDVGGRVEEDLEPAFPDDARVEALHAARGGVARVRERLLLGRLALRVDRQEAGAGQVHLAARLERVGHVLPPELERDRADRARVRGDVVAAHAVAARHGTREPPLLVVERHREPVDLQLRDVGDLALPDRPEDALLELAQLFLGVRVVEAQHRDLVHEGRELGRGPLPHALGGARGRDEIGELGLQLAQLALERVVLLVGDLGLREHVVEVLVAADLLAQPGDPRLGLLARGQGRLPAGRVSGRGRE